VRDDGQETVRLAGWRAPIQSLLIEPIQSLDELTGDFRSLLREVARSPKEAYGRRVAGLLSLTRSALTHMGFGLDGVESGLQLER